MKKDFSHYFASVALVIAMIALAMPAAAQGRRPGGHGSGNAPQACGRSSATVQSPRSSSSSSRPSATMQSPRSSSVSSSRPSSSPQSYNRSSSSSRPSASPQSYNRSNNQVNRSVSNNNRPSSGNRSWGDINNGNNRPSGGSGMTARPATSNRPNSDFKATYNTTKPVSQNMERGKIVKPADNKHGGNHGGNGGGNYRPGDNNGGGNHGGNYRPGDNNGSGNNRGGNHGGNYRPGDNRGGNHGGNYRPGDNRGGNNGGNYRPGDNRGGNHGGNYRPGDNRGNHRPGGNYGHGGPQHRPHHGGINHGGPRPDYNRYRWTSSFRPRVRHDRWYDYYRYNRWSWRAPIAPPVRMWRPRVVWYYRPVIPVGFRYYASAPIITGVLGLEFGTYLDASLNFLYYNGYNIDGYQDNVVYLRDVQMMGYSWPDVMLQYDNGGGMCYAQFTTSSSYQDNYRFDNLYHSLCNTYGSPIRGNNGEFSWYGGNGTGYINLYFNYDAGRYYTVLTFGA